MCVPQSFLKSVSVAILVCSAQKVKHGSEARLIATSFSLSGQAVGRQRQQGVLGVDQLCPRYLKTGSLQDLVKSIRPHNLIPTAGLQNLDLIGFPIELYVEKSKEKGDDSDRALRREVQGEGGD